MPSHRSRVVRAFLVAPLAAPVACTLAILGVGVIRELAGGPSSPSLGASLQLAVGVFAVGTPVAFAAALVAAILTWGVVRLGNSLSRGVLWSIGAMLGCAVSLVLAPFLRGDLFSILFPWWAGALLGIISAEVCWRMLPGKRRFA